MKAFGIHYIVELFQGNVQKLDDLDFLKDVLVTAATLSDSHVLNVFCFKFEPQGVSINLTLSESHLAIHTFPEIDYASLDFYTCSQNREGLDTAIEFIIDQLEVKNPQILKLDRGVTNGL
jgi:S-adenosylmethionine decarboxylase